jgi:hypothetical protein
MSKIFLPQNYRWQNMLARWVGRGDTAIDALRSSSIFILKEVKNDLETAA